MATVGGPGTRRRSVLASRLVGRDEDLATLAARVRAASGGRGGALFVVGEAGIGKSRIVREAAEVAEASGLRILRGRAVDARPPVAYRPLTEALCAAVRDRGVPDAPELAPFRGLLGRLIPEWREEPTAEAAASVVAMSEAVLRFLRAVAADDGCVVVLEDLHWADPETLDVVEYLADNLAREPVLCLATARIEETTPGAELVHVLHARRSAEIVELARLSDGHVAEMVASCLEIDGAPDEVLALAARSEGVPFLVEELLAVAVASGSLVDEDHRWSLSPTAAVVVPLTYADSVRRRLTVVGDLARAVLLAASVLGRRFDWTLLPSISDLAAEDVLSALHAAAQSHLVSVEPDGAAFRFRHALTRDAVLAELLPPERAALAARALAALRDAHPGLPGDSCELAAELAQQAGDRTEAAGLLVRVARRALDAGALSTAEATLERARLLAHDDTVLVDVERLLAQVLSLAGKRDETVEVCTSLLARLGADAEAAIVRAELHLHLGHAAVAATRFAEARAHLEHAAVDAATADDDTLRARVDAAAAQAAMGGDRTEDAATLARAALERAHRLSLPEVACEALEVLGRCERPRDLTAAEAAFAQAHAIADEHGLPLQRVRALHELGTIDLLAGRGTQRLADARETAAAYGAFATAAVLDVQLAAALAVGDAPDEALSVARRGAELSSRYHLRETLAAALAFEALAHARLGRQDALEECERQARSASPDAAHVDMIFGLCRAVHAFVDEDRREATRRLEPAAAIQARSSADSGPIIGMWALVAALERHPDAEHLASPAAEPVHFLGRAYLTYARAVLAGRGGRVDVATELVARADELLRGHEWFRNYGRRLVSEAAVADGWREPALAWLREALAFFDGRRQERIASTCRSLLRRAGAPVPRQRGGEAVPPELRALGVTGREVEVLRLLADGRSNQEIAARLYLSPRTVERHIANLAVKTGVERRAQLVAYAARTVS